MDSMQNTLNYFDYMWNTLKLLCNMWSTLKTFWQVVKHIEKMFLPYVRHLVFTAELELGISWYPHSLN